MEREDRTNTFMVKVAQSEDVMSGQPTVWCPGGDNCEGHTLQVVVYQGKTLGYCLECFMSECEYYHRKFHVPVLPLVELELIDEEGRKD